MDQGTIIPSSLPLSSDYHLAPENDCIDFSTPPNAAAYTNGGAVDRLRRDGPISQPTYHLADRSPHGPRFGPEGGLASEGGSFRPANSFSDANTGSISTSPSSGVSSIHYNGFQTNGFTTTQPGFPGGGSAPQSFVPPYSSRLHTWTEGPPPMHLPSTGFIRSSLTGITTTNDREPFPHSTSFPSRAPLLPGGYGSPYANITPLHASTPRFSLPFTGSGYPPTQMAAMASTTPMAPTTPMTPGTSHTNPSTDCSRFAFPELCHTNHVSFTDQNGATQEIGYDLNARVEKGFFQASDTKWTCYRRNYFSVNMSFSINRLNLAPGPLPDGVQLYLHSGNERKRVQAFGVKISAVIDGSNGKAVELIQHTPKRDAGPKNPVGIAKVAPTAPDVHGAGRPHPVPMGPFPYQPSHPMPHLPLQQVPDADTAAPIPSSSTQPQTFTSPMTSPYGNGGAQLGATSGMQTSHTFDRVQFKCATANNGKRRASQQYFHIHAEVFVDVRKDVNEPPSWVKVAYRISDKIVVRGRSPSHYQNEGGPGSRNGGGNTGNAYPATAAPPTYAGQNTGGFRGMNTYPIRSAGPGGYLPSNYGMHGPGDSPGSDESADGGASDEDQAMDLAAHDSDPMQDTEAYAYYPGSLYDPVSNMTNRLPLPPLPKVESTTPRCSTEPRQYAVTSEYADAIPGPQWGVHPGGRLQGFESSRGFYPDISAGAAGYS